MAFANNKIFYLGIDVVKSVANRKMELDDQINDFDEKVNQKCNRVLELAEQMLRLSLGLKETANRWKSMPNAFSTMSKNEGIINVEVCTQLSNDICQLAIEMECQSKQLIRLAGHLSSTMDRNEIITIVACWVHQPEVNDNMYVLVEERCREFTYI